MILFALTLLCLVRTGASADGDDLQSWYSPPNFRGTWDIIVSCVLTLTICVWSALHLNVPSEGSKLRERNRRRARWIILGLFAPEMVVSTAFAQFLTAKWLHREIQKDVKFRKENGIDPGWSAEQQLQEWSVTQCYFAVMGGLRIQTNPEYIPTHAKLSLTAEGVRLLSFLGRLPQVDENLIKDKSKADGLAKLLVCLQAGWMVLQTLARVHQKLPVTLLEINTMGYVVCAFALYALWWSKPLDIKDPKTILHEDWQDPYVSLMWMCSPICWHQNDFISEIRCLTYTPPALRNTPYNALSINLEDSDAEKTAAAKESPTKPQKTHFSVGSIGARDPIKFIGPMDKFQVDTDTTSPSSPKNANQNVSYLINGHSFKVAPEHEPFFRLQKPHHALRHSKVYCRRALIDCTHHEPLSPAALARWETANLAVDRLWSVCETRPEYKAYFFTTSSIGYWIGELIYLGDHVPNFPGLSYLGSVNVHHDILKAVLAFAGAAYGGLHLSAWNDFFPSKVEKWLWIGCALATGASGIVLALFFLATRRVRAFEVLEHVIRNSRGLRVVGVGVVTPVFLLARMFIVVEAFVSLRRQPKGVYKTPEWTEFLPHL